VLERQIRRPQACISISSVGGVAEPQVSPWLSNPHSASSCKAVKLFPEMPGVSQRLGKRSARVCPIALGHSGCNQDRDAMSQLSALCTIPLDLDTRVKEPWAKGNWGVLNPLLFRKLESPIPNARPRPRVIYTRGCIIHSQCQFQFQ